MRATLLLMLLSAICWAGEAHGAWELNSARSTPSGNQKSVTIRIEPDTRGEVFTLDTVATDGRASTFSTVLYFDGKPRDCSGAQSPRRVDSQTFEILRKCANGGWTRFVRRSAARPKELILEITEQTRDGRRSEQHLVLEKQVLKEQ